MLDDDPIGFGAKKPVRLFNQRLGVDTPGVFKAALKATLAFFTNNAPGAISAAIDTTSALQLRPLPPAELAWLLIRRALAKTMARLAVEALVKRTYSRDDVENLVGDLDQALDGVEVWIDRDFFNHPARHPLLDAASPRFGAWLAAAATLTEAEIRTVQRRLAPYFTFSLHRELAKHAAEYAPLDQEVRGWDTLLLKADERERAWLRNTAWLRRQIEEPLFDEVFGLKEVYVPLRAYFELPEEGAKSFDPNRIESGRHERKVRKVAVDLTAEIRRWLEQPDRFDALRVIAGDPGSGKSSSAKMIAAELAQEGAFRVLYIPLHLFNFTGDLQLALQNFLITGGILPYDPLDHRESEDPLLIFFDGLDEIVVQGHAGQAAAQDFVTQLQVLLRSVNDQRSRLRAVLGGREIMIRTLSHLARKPRQVLHVLPYQLEDAREFEVDERDRGDDFGRDVRPDWWRKYAEASGRDFDGLPLELGRDDLKPITRQPLLNYLLALSYVRQRLDFTAGIGLNEIYGDLLASVFERRWGQENADAGERREERQREKPKPGHPSVQSLTWDDFVRILEEIALLTWHGTGRTVGVDAVEAALDRLRLKAKFAAFRHGAASGAVSLLVAFFFRQAEAFQGEPRFEFTHKTFSEYLIARRLCRALDLIEAERARNRAAGAAGWDEEKALEEWIKLTGPSPLDLDILGFLERQVALQDAGQADRWRSTLAELFSHQLHVGLPMEGVTLTDNPELTRFREMTRQAHNAEEALLAAHACAAGAVKKSSRIDWPNSDALQDLLTRLGQRRPDLVARQSLCWLDRDESNLTHSLYWADLSGAHFQGTNLAGANLFDADLFGANLARADLFGADLLRANLARADLFGAKLYRANLEEANLEGANLEGAHLYGADLRGANLVGVRNLDRAHNVDHLTSWGGAKIERKWVERLQLDVDALGLEVADFEPGHPLPDDDDAQ